MANGFPLACLLIASLAVVSTSFSEDDEATKKNRLGYVFVGTFESPDLSKKPEGAEKTLLVPHYEWDYGVRAFTHKTWAEKEMNWEAFDKAARETADQVVESLEPDVVRDANGVVEYVLLESDDPFLSSILISEKLFPKFRDLLGDRIQALAIDRQIVFLFPAVGGRLPNYGESIVDDFNAAKYPISVEVFLLDENGYRAIGELSR